MAIIATEFSFGRNHRAFDLACSEDTDAQIEIACDLGVTDPSTQLLLWMEPLSSFCYASKWHFGEPTTTKITVNKVTNAGGHADHPQVRVHVKRLFSVLE